MRNRYNSTYERLKTGTSEEEYDSWKDNSYKYENEPAKSKKNAEAEKEFWKLGGTVALVMAFFIILIGVAILL